ncbi:MAG TPA: prepilin-type N-terminal cleavage/methylation domain-containing protein [Planctomycetota bacterium]|jgi:prepilin-type N-terminal cleavage/methylation domain-containing protein|nr:prepilin-type N-terminal cleavage/methylation domain-containing protein [Planctomycetota bacterium]
MRTAEIVRSTRLEEAARRRAPARDPRRQAFTLIEMLIVCSIIAVLAGLTMVGLQHARVSGQETACSVEVQMICSRLQSLKNAFGDFPPTSLADIKIKGNNINEGNESLFAFLLSKKRGGPFADDLKEDRWCNTDNDAVQGGDLKIVEKEILWTRGNAQLLEYMDLWGTPYVYIHSRDYGKRYKYQLDDGTVFEAEAKKNPATGTYYSPTTFQLWSLGRDSVNQNGEGDDIVSWK